MFVKKTVKNYVHLLLGILVLLTKLRSLQIAGIFQRRLPLISVIEFDCVTDLLLKRERPLRTDFF